MKSCLECKTELVGRSDKKFCSDACRIAYHNRVKLEHQKSIKEINAILKSNFTILGKIIQSGMPKTAKEMLAKAGFNFTYHTNTYTTGRGNTYYYCYDYGYCFLDDETVLVVKKESYI